MVDGDRVAGVVTQLGVRFAARAVVLTPAPSSTA
jgi:tRNA U34 5-carboxymethylaminomethyl modifying enzyme MnmG/GidA